MRSMSRYLTVALLVPCLMPLAAKAGELPKNFTLSKGIPADAWMVVHGVNNPEREWVEHQWDRVFKAFNDSGVAGDALGLVFSQIPAAQRQNIEAMYQQVETLINAVAWEDLAAQEMVFAQRMSFPLPNYYILLRGKPGSASKNDQALTNMMRFAAGFNPSFKVVDSESNGATIHSLDLVPEQSISLRTFQKGDIIGILVGAAEPKEVLDLLDGKSGAKSIVDTSRFKKALAKIKSPENEVAFFDIHSIMSSVRTMLDKEMGKIDAHDRDGQTAKRLVTKIINMVDVFDYAITTKETDGMEEITYAATHLKPNKLNSPIAKMFMNRKPFTKYDKYIPQEATNFKLEGFVDLPLIYSTIIEFIKETPDGESGIRELHDTYAKFGFNPETDLFPWWGGEIITVSMPPAVTTAPGQQDGVVMIRVTDAKMAKQKITQGLTFLQQFMQQQQQPLTISPADIRVEGFQKIQQPMLMMMAQLTPVVGVADEWLVVGTSEAAVNRCLDVASGKAPSIADNPRFKREGLVPSGSVTALSFTDDTRFGEDMAATVGSVGMMGGFIVPMIAQSDPQVAAMAPTLNKLFGIVAKTAPVFREMNFFSSSASVTAIDGPWIKQKSKKTYRDPSKTK